MEQWNKLNNQRLGRPREVYRRTTTKRRGETKKEKNQKREPKRQHNQRDHQQHHETSIRKQDRRDSDEYTNIKTAMCIKINTKNTDNIDVATPAQPSSPFATSPTVHRRVAFVGANTLASTHRAAPAEDKQGAKRKGMLHSIIVSLLNLPKEVEKLEPGESPHCLIYKSVANNI